MSAEAHETYYFTMTAWQCEQVGTRIPLYLIKLLKQQPLLSVLCFTTHHDSLVGVDVVNPISGQVSRPNERVYYLATVGFA